MTLRFRIFLRRKLNGSAGFTRVELMAALACIALLSALALPAFAATRSRSDVVQCLNNLRQMGRAVQMWGGEHVNDPPWHTFDYQGGTRPPSGTKPGNAWFELSYMSNELATPRILACPSDNGVNVARTFPEYMTAPFRARATSYFINLHTLGSVPSSILYGDRNVQFTPGGNCYLSVNNTVTLDLFNSSTGGWTNAVHRLQGQIVRIDGSAFETNTEELRTALRRSETDNGRSGSGPHMLRGGF